MPQRSQAAGSPSVLFVVGSMRSGTTLLAQMLGQHAQVFAAGELSNLWSSFENGGHCGCGATVASCNFWAPLTKSVVRAAGIRSPQEVEKLRSSVARTRHIVSVGHGPMFDAQRRRYIAVLKLLHGEILARSGRSILVDTSKKPVDLLIASHASPTAAVHIVRSPYGVAASDLDRTKHAEVPLVDRPPTKKAARSALEWVVVNYLARFATGLIDGPVVQMTYEQLVQQPSYELDRICRAVQLETHRWEIQGRRFNMPAHHLVSGNPSRRRSGWQDLATPDLGGNLTKRDVWSIRSVVSLGNFGEFQAPDRRCEERRGDT